MLLDRDFASGKATDVNDRQVYLETNPDNHRVLLRWELENYLYDREVLKRYSKQRGLEFDEECYDEKIGNINDDKVKDITGVIKNICGLKGNTSSERFKLELSKCITSDLEVYKGLRDCIFY